MTSPRRPDHVVRPTKAQRQADRRAARRAAEEAAARAAITRRRLRRASLLLSGVVVIAIVALLTLPSILSSTPPTTTTSSTTSTTTTTTIPTAKAASLQAAANKLAVAAGCPASPSTRANTLSWKTSPKMSIDLKKNYYAKVVTTAGTFTIALNAKAAPITVNNFVFLAQHNYYHCVTFHRVIPGFMLQGGDPTSTGTGGPGYTIGDEYPKAASPTYPLFSVAMANESTPHTGGSQFFIVSGPSGETLPNTYSLFGKVISGQSVISTIASEGTSVNNGTPPRVIQRMLFITITSS